MNESAVADWALDVLLASSEADLLDIGTRALGALGDKVTRATSVADAIRAAEAARFDVAFVDVTLDDDSGIALVHHLGAVCPQLVVHVISPPAKVALATEAISLGARGMHVGPITGDQLAQAASDARARFLETKRRDALEREIATLRRRDDLLERVIRAACTAAPSDAIHAVADALAHAAGARGAALYATSDAPTPECVRLAAIGSARDMPQVARGDELANTFELRKARPFVLRGAHGTLGIAAIEGGNVDVAEEHPTLIDLATIVLTLSDGRRARGPAMKDELGAAYTLAYFKDIGAREIDKAKRHGRRMAVCNILDAEEHERGAHGEHSHIDDVIRHVVRDTDVVAASASNEYVMLLSETGALGAHACRRRLIVRAEGDRRARTASAATDRRGAVPARRDPLAIGIASYPHDGASLDRLMRLARNRAAAQANSAVLALGLAALSLPDAVDALLAKPILDAVPCSPAPLDLAIPALVSMVTQACREARRGGAATVFVTVQPGMGIASAARHAMRDASDVQVRAVDARGAPGCADIDAIVVFAEHGSWVCCGRFTHDRFRGVHAADPLLADLVAHRIALAGGQRGP